MTTPRTFTLVGFDEESDSDDAIFPAPTQARVFLTRVPPEYAHYRVRFRLTGAGECMLQYAMHRDLWNVMADPDSPFQVSGMLMSVGELAISRFKHEFALNPGQPVDPLLRTLIRGLVLPIPRVSTSPWILAAVEVAEAFWDAAAQRIHDDRSGLPCCQRGANEAVLACRVNVSTKPTVVS